jgi:ABC-type multidrug transport system fused ATPase/permease subunit
VKYLLWGVVLFSPQYSFMIALSNVFSILHFLTPSVSDIVVLMLVESFLYIFYAYHLDSMPYCKEAAMRAPMSVEDLATLNNGVREEREKTENLKQMTLSNSTPTILIVDEVKKVYSPSRELNLQNILQSLYRSLCTSSTHDDHDDAQPRQNLLQVNDKVPTVAVDNVSFHVSKGEIFGLLGSNGAGENRYLHV